MAETRLIDVERLRCHIAELAESPRPAESGELEAARQYVGDSLQQAGWVVERVPFVAESEGGGRLQGVNLVARYRGHFSGEGPRFCVGAHLDSHPESPGADDNASAVAALLEIARLLPLQWPDNAAIELELVAFDLEEKGMLGGVHHAQTCLEKNINLRGMVSFEMLGYCDPTPGAQTLPLPLTGLYPDTGDFIAVIGNQISGPLIEMFANGMKQVDGLPVETLSVPANGEFLQATRLSDHSPFWDAGYPALMITDTSFLRNPHYHLASDTLETLDMEFLARVAQGCLKAVQQVVAFGL